MDKSPTYNAGIHDENISLRDNYKVVMPFLCFMSIMGQFLFSWTAFNAVLYILFLSPQTFLPHSGICFVSGTAPFYLILIAPNEDLRHLIGWMPWKMPHVILTDASSTRLTNPHVQLLVTWVEGHFQSCQEKFLGYYSSCILFLTISFVWSVPISSCDLTDPWFWDQAWSY